MSLLFGMLIYLILDIFKKFTSLIPASKFVEFSGKEELLTVRGETCSISAACGTLIGIFALTF